MVSQSLSIFLISHFESVCTNFRLSESCDMWLHGRCINITKRTLPQVYICAFCAQTPTARNVRMPASGAAASSPLAHKSFKTFR